MPAQQRYMMCCLAVFTSLSPDFPVYVSDHEVQHGAMATLDSLVFLRDAYPQHEFSWVIGSDWLQPDTDVGARHASLHTPISSAKPPSPAIPRGHTSQNTRAPKRLCCTATPRSLRPTLYLQPSPPPDSCVRGSHARGAPASGSSRSSTFSSRRGPDVRRPPT